MLHDLHECHSSEAIVNGVKKRVERHVSTVSYNLPYGIQKSKKQQLQANPKYPRGTFFVITDNGKKPELNKHLKPKTK